MIAEGAEALGYLAVVRDAVEAHGLVAETHDVEAGRALGEIELRVVGAELGAVLLGGDDLAEGAKASGVRASAVMTTLSRVSEDSDAARTPRRGTRAERNERRRRAERGGWRRKRVPEDSAETRGANALARAHAPATATMAMRWDSSEFPGARARTTRQPATRGGE